MSVEIFTASHPWRNLIVGFYGDGEERVGRALSDFFDTVPLFGRRTELCNIMAAHGSDKVGWHNYTPMYHHLFGPMRDRVFDLFEVGIGTNFQDVQSHMPANYRPGASLRGWREYFPKAQIVAADVDRRILFNDERISTYYVDQMSRDTIDNLWRKLPDRQFDIIIDDGLHSYESNINFLEASFHKLRRNGYYVIEDILQRPDNIALFHEKFSQLGLPGLLVKLPILVSHEGQGLDNCLAIFGG
jgi:hypothetical protein